MIIQPFENYARSFGPWLSAYQRVAADFTRISNQQTELALQTATFLTDRLSAYGQYNDNVESLTRTLDDLTNRYTAVYTERIKEMSSSWAEVLREDRNVDELSGVVQPSRDAQSPEEGPPAQKRRPPQEQQQREAQ